MLKYSIIVPIYNVSKYLDKCVNSIISNKYKNMEIILVNDCSQDDSLQICLKYQKIDTRIKIINKAQRGGLVSARKEGYKLAKGKYIINIDGDDFISSNYIEKIESIINDETDIVYINFSYFYNSDNKIIKSKSLKFKNQILNKEQINEFIIPNLINGYKNNEEFHNSIFLKIFKKSILENNLNFYKENISMGEDLLLTLIIVLNSNSIYFLDEYLYYYRQTESQMTKTYNKDIFLNQNNLFYNVKTFIDKIDFNDKETLMNNLLKMTFYYARSILRKVLLQHKKDLEYCKNSIYNSDVFNNEMKNYKLYAKNWSKKDKLFAYLIKNKKINTIKYIFKLRNFKNMNCKKIAQT